jgi:hypothetical protein
MKRRVVRITSVAWAAAVALIFTGGALAAYPSIVSSFPLTGATPPGPRGIHRCDSSVFVISYTAPAVNYLYEFSYQGSFISSVPLRGANVIAETDRLPEPYPDYYFSAVDTGTRDIKIYNTAGSLVGTFMAAPDAVAIGVGGHVVDYVYLATRGGLIRRYSPQGSFLGSFTTAITVRDLAASGGYDYMWGYFVQVGPRGVPGPIYSYWGWGYTGSLAGTFTLPGTASLGAEVTNTFMYWCLRRVSTRLWVYLVDLGKGMPVEPASLGRVKALFN